MDNITNCILAVINDLKLFNAADKLGSLDEIIWRNTGERIWSELSNNLSALIDYLKSEYQQGRKIDPQIECLRDSLHVVETAIHDAVKDKNKRVILEFQALRSKCAEWIEWIDRYYPQAQTTQGAESKTTHGNVRQETAAAARLASQGIKDKTTIIDDIKSCILIPANQQDKFLKKLHSLVDGKKGKAVALVIRLCVETGLMSKPTFGVLLNEFPGVGNKSGYNRYYREFPTIYTEYEKNGIKKHLEPFIGQI